MTGACEACGWMAAVASSIAFGSFGAPIKSRVVTSLDIDPLVFQSYKTLVCFLTSWLVLLLGQEFTFTPWGIVSGFFWVPGGVATIFAVKSAGLAVGIGVGSSFIVLVSFVWGIFIFNENVRSKAGACFAVALMIVGIVGMSTYSAPEPALQDYSLGRTYENGEGSEIDEALSGSLPIGLEMSSSTQESSLDGSSAEEFQDEVQTRHQTDSSNHDTDVVICGHKFQRRTLGILAAVFNGTWGGSIMVPMHWSRGGTGGIGYVISFAIGASVITLMLWVIRFCFAVNTYRSFNGAYSSLPSFHFRKMWLQGCTSGLLWSIGNFFSMISVNHLGEGVGYSVIQVCSLHL